MKSVSKDPWLLLLCGLAAIVVAILAVSGQLAGEFTPDTSSYFGATVSPIPWGETRNPIYGYVASWFGGSATNVGGVVLAQMVLHVAAVLIFYAGARRGGIGTVEAFALAVAALLSQSGLYHLRLLLPESPAISCLLVAFGFMIAASKASRGFGLLAVLIALFTGAAYVLRPSLLPAIAVVPAIFWLLAWRNRQLRTIAHAGLLLLATAAPFLIQSAIRYRAVGDFNVVSFGGYQMTPLAGFMLTPDIVARLPEGVQPTARAVLALRQNAEAAGAVARTPINSTGERSFVSAAIGYFDIYARSYDDFLAFGVMKLRTADESWVVFNRRLMQFSFATVATVPQDWLAWIGGATARLVGHSLVMNATFLVATLLLLSAAFPAFVRRTGTGMAGNDLAAVSVIALGWLACNVPLIVAVTFPATRYIDTGALLLPAVPLALAIALVQGLRHSPDEQDRGGADPRCA